VDEKKLTSEDKGKEGRKGHKKKTEGETGGGKGGLGEYI